ncbi:hypothetical protein [Comamonas sp. JUb58]|nr:hypothetical protein [Comamonas sp. JUb58]
MLEPVQKDLQDRFDNTCYNALSGTATFPSNAYGEPRNVMLTVRFRF